MASRYLPPCVYVIIPKKFHLSKILDKKKKIIIKRKASSNVTKLTIKTPLAIVRIADRGEGGRILQPARLQGALLPAQWQVHLRGDQQRGQSEPHGRTFGESTPAMDLRAARRGHPPGKSIERPLRGEGISSAACHVVARQGKNLERLPAFDRWHRWKINHSSKWISVDSLGWAPR